MAMEKFCCVIRYLRGLESLWLGRGAGRLSLLGVKVKDDRICISDEDANRIFGIKNFAAFWKTNSPITAYRVYQYNGVEFEGIKGKIMSYLFVGAFAYHLMRIHVAADELEKIEAELSNEIAEYRRQNVHQEEMVPEVAVEVEIPEEEEEEEEEEDEPPQKRRKLPWGICRTSEYDPERMEPHPRCGERLKRQLHEKGLVLFLPKDREEEPDSDADAYLTPTKMTNTYENVHQIHDYENTFNITTEY
jgi:hypothetical protein